jgi:hypothetical protein
MPKWRSWMPRLPLKLRPPKTLLLKKKPLSRKKLLWKSLKKNPCRKRSLRRSQKKNNLRKSQKKKSPSLRKSPNKRLRVHRMRMNPNKRLRVHRMRMSPKERLRVRRMRMNPKKKRLSPRKKSLKKEAMITEPPTERIRISLRII